jgi:putative membrane protein
MVLAHAGYWAGGWWFFGPWFWIPLWILLFFLIRGLFWRRYWRNGPGYGPGYPGRWYHSGDNDPRVILAQRYARGEISEQEYRERMAVLDAPRAQ